MEINETLDSNVIQKDQKVSEHHLASGGKRFANYLIDMVIIYILMFLVVIAHAASTGNVEIETIVSYLYAAIIIVLYYSIMESTTGKTIGKMITGTRVVYDDFSKPTFGKIFTRSLCRLIPFEPFSCLGSKPTGWHDSIPDLFVIDEKSIRG